MALPARLHVPFSELWRMRIEHPYSLLVRSGDLAWSCGQCPLSADGAVLAPDDLGRQAAHVVDYVRRVLDRAQLTPADVGKLVLYHAPAAPGDTGRLLDQFGSAFPGTLLMPIGTPYFYYPGMRIEVDVHASARRRAIAIADDDAQGVRIAAVDGGALIWVSVGVADAGGSDNLQADAVRRVLAAAGLSANALLADHWFVGSDDPGPALDRLGATGLVTDPGAAVRVSLPARTIALGELTFARDAVIRETIAAPAHRGVSVFAKRSRTHFWIAARSTSSAASLVAEATAIMTATADSMCALGWRFDAVCKATTHYVGSSAAEDLHDNMAVRNAYYRRPGPASTGLPIASFPLSDSRIAVDLLGVNK